MKIAELELKSLTELRKMGGELGIPDAVQRQKECLMVSVASRTGGESGDDGAGLVGSAGRGAGKDKRYNIVGRR